MKIDTDKIDKETALKLIEALKQVAGEEEPKVEPEVEPEEVVAERAPRKKSRRRKKKVPTGKKDVKCRNESIKLGVKKNKFWELKEGSRKLSETNKRDSAIDKKLSGNYVKRERREPALPVEVDCVECEKVFEVSPSLLKSDGSYRCDRCCAKGK